MQRVQRANIKERNLFQVTSKNGGLQGPLHNNEAGFSQRHRREKAVIDEPPLDGAERLGGSEPEDQRADVRD